MFTVTNTSKPGLVSYSVEGCDRSIEVSAIADTTPAGRWEVRTITRHIDGNIATRYGELNGTPSQVRSALIKLAQEKRAFLQGLAA